MTFAPDLHIHPTTRQLIEVYAKNPHHALILHGSPGVGLTTIANAIGAEISTQPITAIGPIDDKDITIEQVRELYNTTRSTEPSAKVVIIDDAHRMSMPAQNAFLKLLEEPPSQVYFIMVAHVPHQLLPTIHSRSSALEVRPLPLDDTKRIIQSFVSDEARARQVAFLAQGRPAHIARLVSDEKLFEKKSTLVSDARRFLQGSAYDRMVLVNAYSKQRDIAIDFVEMIGHLLQHTSTKQPSIAEKLFDISHAIDRLHENANTKLQLTHLALTL